MCFEAKQRKIQRDPTIVPYIYIFGAFKTNGIKETNVPLPFDHFTHDHISTAWRVRKLGFTTVRSVEAVNVRAGIRWTKKEERWTTGKQTLGKVDA